MTRLFLIRFCAHIYKYKKADKIRVSEISFVIGGSNGLSNDVIKASKLVLSFGKITYPHQLFRVVLAEQIYRAFAIIAGLPYHK